MMLFNIKQCRWRSVARQEFEQHPESLLAAADRRRITLPVCVHTENNVFEFQRHGATRRCTSRSVCDPLYTSEICPSQKPSSSLDKLQA